MKQPKQVKADDPIQPQVNSPKEIYGGPYIFKINDPSRITEVNEGGDLLCQWSGGRHVSLILQYRGSRNTFTLKEFHRVVDGKGPNNFIFIKSDKNHVFGAFASKPFYTPKDNEKVVPKIIVDSEPQKDENAYIFSLTRKTMHK